MIKKSLSEKFKNSQKNAIRPMYFQQKTRVVNFVNSRINRTSYQILRTCVFCNLTDRAKMTIVCSVNHYKVQKKALTNNHGW